MWGAGWFKIRLQPTQPETCQPAPTENASPHLHIVSAASHGLYERRCIAAWPPGGVLSKNGKKNRTPSSLEASSPTGPALESAQQREARPRMQKALPHWGSG